MKSVVGGKYSTPSVLGVRGHSASQLTGWMVAPLQVYEPNTDFLSCLFQCNLRENQ